MFGFLNINKPSGITSHKVISILRKITGIKQIGHAGTLDPLARGVLPVAIGKASKLIDYLDEDKTYQVTFKLGFISDTFDIEGRVKKLNEVKVNLEDIHKILLNFQGRQKQIPPAFSAVHYQGRRLYELARKGIIPEDIPSREITIYSNKLLHFDSKNQIIKLEISCSKGTYIRSIVNDIGIQLNTGAVMTELVRTKAAGMNIENSITLTDEYEKENLEKHFINPLDILSVKSINILESEYELVQNGNKFLNKTQYNGNCLLCFNNKLIAIAEAQEKYIQPKKVLL